MLAPTHSVFGIFLTLIILAFFGVSFGLHWTIILFAVIGSIMPDIDHPRSVIGRLFYPISVMIENKFAHRTFTHSFIGWIVFTIIFAILAGVGTLLGGETLLSHALGGETLLSHAMAWLYPRWVAAFAIGYFSHLVLDMFNKRGVPMFWPDTLRNVIPKDPRYRVDSGSRVELLIFIILFILMLLAFPLSKYGISSSVHWIVATPENAIEESKDIRTRADVDFIGEFATTKIKVTDTAQLIDTDKDILIILYKGCIYTLSDKKQADIFATKVRIKKTNVPINIEQKEFANISGEDLLALIPEGSLITGNIKIPDGVGLYLPNNEITYKTVEQKGSTLILNYANRSELAKIRLTEKDELQKRKDMVELNGLYNKAKMIKLQLDVPALGSDLTPLGKKLLLKEEDLYKDTLNRDALKVSLADVNIQIEEMKLKIKSKQLLFSGNIYMRRTNPNDY